MPLTSSTASPRSGTVVPSRHGTARPPRYRSTRSLASSPASERGVVDWEEVDEQERALERGCRRLVAGGTLVRLGRRSDEWRLFSDFDLASFAENRLGEVLDPTSLDSPTRSRWTRDALRHRLPTRKERKDWGCYWIVREGVRVGTFALSRFCLGGSACVSSVYLRPSYRGAGIMTALLDAVRAVLGAQHLGLRLEASWTWQRAVRFYLRCGFWLRSWKHDLDFIRGPDTPAPVVDVGEREASVSVDAGSEILVLARARRDEARLLEHGDAGELPPDLRSLSWNARTTLTLAIALRGWPLIRSDRHWRECRHSDAVQPEALAQRILIWEEYSAAQGWRVETPRIPGLAADLLEGR